MVTVSAANIPWRDVAAAGPGSALYADIVRWAQTIKARGATVMVAWQAELVSEEPRIPTPQERLRHAFSSDIPENVLEAPPARPAPATSTASRRWWSSSPHPRSSG